MQGTFNAVAGNIKNKDLMRLLAKKYHRPFIPLGVPVILLKTFLGEMSPLLLYGSQIDNSFVKSKGFAFADSSMEKYLRTIK